MTIHLPSFLLGLGALPFLLLALMTVLRLIESMASSNRRSGIDRPVPTSLDPLRFTPRLISKLRRPLDAEEDHARAS